MEELIKTIKIEYKKPIFYRHVLANVIDFIILSLVAIGIFIGVRAIVEATPGYKQNLTKIDSYKIESGLYVKKDDTTIDIITYLNSNDNYSYGQKNTICRTTIDNFIIYINDKTGAANAKTVQENYDSYRLNDGFIFDGQKYFIKQDNVVIKNPNCTATEEKYYTNVYTPYIDSNLNSYLITMMPEYFSITKTNAFLILFLEIPVSLFIGAILTYFIPPLFFKRERYTIGKFLYRIGEVGPDFLHVKFSRFLIKEVIFIVGIVVLSLFTVGIPLIISFTMMAFSKFHQSFPNYMSGIYCVDTSNDKIFYTKQEVEIEQIVGVKKPVDFKLPEIKD